MSDEIKFEVVKASGIRFARAGAKEKWRPVLTAFDALKKGEAISVPVNGREPKSVRCTIRKAFLDQYGKNVVSCTQTHDGMFMIIQRKP